MLLNAVLLVELIDTSVRSCGLLLTRVERMALGADLYADVLFGRACHKCITAVTGYRRLVIIRMDSFSHNSHLSKN